MSVLNDNELRKLVSRSVGRDGRLTLNYLHIDRVNQRSFGNLTNLKVIDLESNSIKYIASDAFSKFVQVEKVLLKRNDLQIIQRELFENNPRIHYLNLSFNRIGVIQRNAFETLTEIEYIYLDGNPLQQLDGDMFSKNLQLIHLHLSNIQLKRVNEGLFRNLRILFELDLSYNEIVNISENVFQNNSRLVRLYLNNNRINHLPHKIFHNLKSVDRLHLFTNNISELSEVIFSEMTNLSYCEVNGNELRTLDPNLFAQNKQLFVLDMSYNKLTRLSQGLFRRNELLRKITLHHNQLREIAREDFEKNKVLADIDMAHNRIRRIDETAFNIPLEHLNLEFNQIQDLHPNVFKKVKNHLKILLLNNNNLQRVNDTVFSDGMNKLIILNLGHNQIRDSKFFRHRYFANLTDLYLNNNKLREVSSILSKDSADEASKVKGSLQNLFLQHNEIEFDKYGYSGYNQIDLWELKFLNISNNKIVRFSPYFSLKETRSITITIDLRNNRILKVNWYHLPNQIFGPGQIYLWESSVPIAKAHEVKSFKYFGHSKFLKIKKYHLTVKVVLRNVMEIMCEDDLIIVSLRIQNNKLRKIDCLSKVWTLHFIDFSYNELTTLKKDHFAKMIYLETLDISHNQLTSLNLKVFVAAVKLKEFYFDGCQVQFSWQYYSIPEMFPRLTNISMQNNSIYCPLLPTILQKLQNFNITIMEMKKDHGIVFESVDGIFCEDYQSTKEILIITVYSTMFVILSSTIAILFILNHKNKIRMNN